jgi:hypothetical protein
MVSDLRNVVIQLAMTSFVCWVAAGSGGPGDISPSIYSVVTQVYTSPFQPHQRSFQVSSSSSSLYESSS